jgi:hypothetical protein
VWCAGGIGRGDWRAGPVHGPGAGANGRGRFEELDDQTIAAWSLGLRKFGRPELVLLGLDPDAATEAALLLRDLAQALADGERIEPGDSVGTPAGLQWTVERFAPERWPKVAVDGDAIVMRRQS